jgi:hypothetical protein
MKWGERYPCLAGAAMRFDSYLLGIRRLVEPPPVTSRRSLEYAAMCPVRSEPSR